MSSFAGNQQVVFIDSRVPDLQDLVEGVDPGTQVFVLDPATDGIEQIANILAADNFDGLASISIVGHGSAGEISLGSTVLDDSDLSSHSAALAQIGASLVPGGNLQLFACDVASGASGQQFIADLSQFTGGVDVAAATHAIGLTGNGENWTLDASTGPLPAPAAVPFTAEAQANFQGTLAGNLDGQLWFIANGGDTDAVTGHVNTDGSSVTQAGAQANDHQSQTVAFDLAAGFYFTITGLRLEARSISDPSTVIGSVQIGNDLNTPSTGDDDVVNAVAIDPFTHTLYVGLWGQDADHTGVVVVNYNTATGALDPNAAYGTAGVYDNNTTYLITNSSTGGKITDVRDFSIDLINHKLYWTDDDNQYSFAPFSATNNISVVTYNSGTPDATVVKLTDQVQFPTNQSNGIIGPEAVDVAKGLIYFETNHVGNSTGTLWYMPTTGGTASQVSLPAGSAIGFGDIPQGGISIDPQSQYIFITVQSGTAFAGPDEILQGQLSADGHSITSWVNTYPIATLDGHTPDANAHIADTWFDQLPTLSSLTGTGTHAASPTIT